MSEAPSPAIADDAAVAAFRPHVNIGPWHKTPDFMATFIHSRRSNGSLVGTVVLYPLARLTVQPDDVSTESVSQLVNVAIAEVTRHAYR